jgi:hypothetical protein
VRRARRTSRRLIRAALRNDNRFPVTGELVLRGGGHVVARSRFRLPPESSRRVSARLSGGAGGRGAELRIALRLTDPAGGHMAVPGPELRGSRLGAWVRDAL